MQCQDCGTTNHNAATLDLQNKLPSPHQWLMLLLTQNFISLIEINCTKIYDGYFA